MALTFAVWKASEFWMENHRLSDSNYIPKPATEEFIHTIHWPIGIRLYSLGAGSLPAEDAVQLVLDDPIPTSSLTVETPPHRLEA
jgi:hypothetical protein